MTVHKTPNDLEEAIKIFASRLVNGRPLPTAAGYSAFTALLKAHDIRLWTEDIQMSLDKILEDRKAALPSAHPHVCVRCRK
jgi:hypothetical protein